jgi:hypothetical protein
MTSLTERLHDFPTEAALVEQFILALNRSRSAFGKVHVTTEWNHTCGQVDVLARDRASSLIAFEAKLTDWRRAFLQAYRNTAYANKVYVLLPDSIVHRAIKSREEFEDRGIGLCTFDGKKIRIVVEAVEQEPLLEWVRKKAHEHFNGLGHECLARHGGRSGRDLPAARA